MPDHEAAPLSLEFRTVQKRKRLLAARAILAIGVLITAVGVYGFARGGAELLGVWGLAFGLGASALGIVLLLRASKLR